MSHRKLPPCKNRSGGGFLGASETRKYRIGIGAGMGHLNFRHLLPSVGGLHLNKALRKSVCTNLYQGTELPKCVQLVFKRDNFPQQERPWSQLLLLSTCYKLLIQKERCPSQPCAPLHNTLLHIRGALQMVYLAPWKVFPCSGR